MNCEYTIYIQIKFRKEIPPIVPKNSFWESFLLLFLKSSNSILFCLLVFCFVFVILFVCLFWVFLSLFFELLLFSVWLNNIHKIISFFQFILLHKQIKFNSESYTIYRSISEKPPVKTEEEIWHRVNYNCSIKKMWVIVKIIVLENTKTERKWNLENFVRDKCKKHTDHEDDVSVCLKLFQDTGTNKKDYRNWKSAKKSKATGLQN